MKNIEHLHLLIGTNPLSNYVVADYFLKNADGLKTIHLIHSADDLENNIQGTRFFASHLKSVLEKNESEGAKNIQIYLHEIRIKDAFSIHSDLKSVLLSLKNQNSKNIHLDYSGGTKEMSLHAYETFKEVFGEAATFSYFDSRRNRLKEDSDIHEPIVSVFLGDKIEIGFEDLFELHGYRAIPEDENSGGFSAEFFKDFLDVITNPDNFCKYLKWRKHFYDIYPDPGKVIPVHGKNKLSDLLPHDSEFSALLEKALFLKILEDKPEYSLIENRNGEHYLKTDVSNKQMSKLIETRKYITGKWFEQYVYSVLKKNLFDKNIISSIDLNVLVQTASKNFEIDVALIKGYELCGISCTTDKTQSLCKSKGFEILHRTKQIAGDSSKAILMTFMNAEHTAEMDADLSEILEDRILVLGMNDLFPQEEFCRKVADFLSF
ncbi:hypothetical protein MmiEs2_14750 [Methanimicrococcus stummii]|uniref:Uncharacterized protein n=1 Tax=Methanimicrococcus stummii TaxID=3028294 RepID=A0AA96VBH0_9EURY|nr:hypothetical protein [Methanimicrococcus sp. Es2]WNY29250.1 hypothetical protein MmiEs2_14750 [Methanimicrococcus sp. Es2]